MITDNSFNTKYHWMKTRLGLKGAEKDVFSIINGYCREGQGIFTGSISYIAELADISDSTASLCLKKLLDKDYIIKYNNGANKANSYIVNQKLVIKLKQDKTESIARKSGIPEKKSTLKSGNDLSENRAMTYPKIGDIPIYIKDNNKDNYIEGKKEAQESLENDFEILENEANNLEPKKEIIISPKKEIIKEKKVAPKKRNADVIEMLEMYGLDELEIKDYLQARKDRKGVISIRVLQNLEKVAKKLGLTPKDAVNFQTYETTWQGFTAVWYNNRMNPNGKNTNKDDEIQYDEHGNFI